MRLGEDILYNTTQVNENMLVVEDTEEHIITTGGSDDYMLMGELMDARIMMLTLYYPPKKIGGLVTLSRRKYYDECSRCVRFLQRHVEDLLNDDVDLSHMTARFVVCNQKDIEEDELEYFRYFENDLKGMRCRFTGIEYLYEDYLGAALNTYDGSLWMVNTQ